jgi:hypothetical protein
MYERTGPVGPPAEQLDVRIRAFEPGDQNIILKTWLLGYRDMVRGIPETLYFDQQKRLIYSISRRSKVAIACDHTMPAFVLGFVVAYPLRENCEPEDPLIAHYGWVRAPYRRLGILRLMLLALGWTHPRPIHVTHWTHRSRDLQKRLNLINNPYPIMDMTREQASLYSAS